MDFLYLPKLIINDIDSVIISLITGVVTSVLVSRIFLIKQSEDEKMRRLKPRIEVLAPIDGGMQVIVHFSKELTKEEFNDFLYYWVKQVSDTLKEESQQFMYMTFEDLDKKLHSVAVQHNDLIEQMCSCTSTPKEISKLSIKKLKGWSDEIKIIRDKYNNYSAKTSKNVLYKNILLDKFVIIIGILILVLLLIA